MAQLIRTWHRGGGAKSAIYDFLVSVSYTVHIAIYTHRYYYNQICDNAEMPGVAGQEVGRSRGPDPLHP